MVESFKETSDDFWEHEPPVKKAKLQPPPPANKHGKISNIDLSRQVLILQLETEKVKQDYVKAKMNLMQKDAKLDTQLQELQIVKLKWEMGITEEE